MQELAQRVPPSGPFATPAAIAQLLVRIGFDNSTEPVFYNVGESGPLLRTVGGEPLSVTLTGFRPGNLILTGLSLSGVDAIASGPLGTEIRINPRVDLGAGPRLIFQNGSPFTGGIQLPALTWIAPVVPVPAEVQAAPIVSWLSFCSGNDGAALWGYGVLGWAAELDTSTGLITQLPTTVLAP